MFRHAHVADPQMSTFLLSLVNVAMTFIALTIMEKAGRRPLLMCTWVRGAARPRRVLPLLSAPMTTGHPRAFCRLLPPSPAGAIVTSLAISALPAQRMVNLQAFNAPDSTVFLFLMTTRAGGLGINLTGADLSENQNFTARSS